MPWIKLPPALQPIKAFLNDAVRKTAGFISDAFSRISTGPDVFYKKNNPFDKFGGGPPDDKSR